MTDEKCYIDPRGLLARELKPGLFLQLHRERRGENIGVLPQVIVGVSILVEILEQEARLELPANLRFQCVTELVARVQR